jgi:hypothetical protein
MNLDPEALALAHHAYDKTDCGLTDGDDPLEAAVIEYLSSAFAVEVAARWHPIETAPRDGTEMLIFLGPPWSRVEKARYYEPWNNWQVGIVPSDPVREEHYGIGFAIPTHWMPLPEPPE